jgi:hypothetical protein
MEQYPKRFIQAGLIYALLAALLGIAISVEPAWAQKIRFVHIHFNLLGFMAMFIAGVAFHVLPRFSARSLPWPAGMKYQFILQNVGLLGMCSAHLAGGIWKGGTVKTIFIVFAVMSAIAIGLMFYNLYFVLMPAKEVEKPDEITADMKVATVLDAFPQALEIFLKNGFTTLANPAARNTFARVVSIEKACEKHGVECQAFIATLNEELLAEGRGQASETSKPVKEEHSEGEEIRKGEACQAETRVGSLINVYPETKSVFEKHYGEGCFSCPGHVLETVEQTASMHNVNLDLILKEINDVIDK